MLGALEDKRRNEPVVVIGVHSAKFEAEADAERIAEAVARHGVRHPVVVDEGYRIWRAYAVRSWPTLVLIRPDGTIAAVSPGEADLGPLDAEVGRALDEARSDGTLARTPFRAEAPGLGPPGPLAFPGRVVGLPGGRLAVSDTGHNRLLVLDAEGRALAVAGSGEAGLADGPLAAARFRHPQGLAWDAEGDLLFVADTGNHALREVSLERGRVRTIAGNGSLGRGMPRGPVPAAGMPLRSPWDVAVAGDYLLVAMAGTHQIWALNRPAETLGVLAGSGREAIEDGPFVSASFAQPSGLALSGPRLYLADSETSAVRFLDLPKGEVRTLVGTGLFDFGDRDGVRGNARLQHPLAVAHGPRGLLVADTYNDKIRSVDEETGEVATAFAGGDGVSLREPGGLCQLPDGRIVVADTNHHRLIEIRRDGTAHVLDVAVEASPATASVQGQGSADRGARSEGGVEEEGASVFALPRASVGVGDVTLRLRLEPPAGFDLAEGSRVSVRISCTGSLEGPGADQGFTVSGGRRAVPLRLRASGPGEASLEVAIEAVVCSHGDAAACWPVSAIYRGAVTIGSAAAVIDATLRLPSPGR